MSRVRLLGVVSLLSCLAFAAHQAAAGGLTFVEAEDDMNVVQPEAIAISPNTIGNSFVYTVSSAAQGLISVFSRNPTTGELTHVETHENGDVINLPIDGIREAKAVAVAEALPSGTHVYVAGAGTSGGGIGVFKSDATSGSLTFIESHPPEEGVCAGGTNDLGFCTSVSACPGGECVSLLKGADGIVLNPDAPVGQHVYVSARGGDSVAVYTRNATSGVLTLTSAVKTGFNSVTLMQNPRNLTISPDGLSVYVAAQGTQGGTKDGTIVVFDRNTGTGELTFKQAVKYNDPLVTDPIIQRMADPEALVVSPDLSHLYVASGTSDAIVIFSRTLDGTITYVGYQDDGKLHDTNGITMTHAPDDPVGKYVYATSKNDAAINLYVRDPVTGTLNLLDTRIDSDASVCVGGPNDGNACKDSKGCKFPAGVCDIRPKLFGAIGVALSPDSDHLYVTSRGHGAVDVFENDTCGNGNVGADEECDDGNLIDTDTCKNSCVLNVCGAVPMPCRTPSAPAQATILIKNNPLQPDTKDSIQFKWKKGSATTAADFGDPTVSADYVLCVYDNTGLLMSRAAPRGGVCAKGKNCWKQTLSGKPAAISKYTYQDKLYTPAGLSDVQLKVGGVGKAQVTVKGGKSPFLQPPTLPLTLPVTVQVVVNSMSTSACWGATFVTPTTDPVDATKFSAKSQ